MELFSALSDDDLVLDSLPDDVVSSIEVRNANMQNLSFGGSLGLEFLVSDLQRWVPGSTVRVAFLDGDSDLHRDIMEATRQITDAGNISLDFGETSDGNFRRWTEQDTDFSAEIRVSFDKSGYFSLVGVDSIDGNVGSPFGRVGGRPNQASLNLGGFAFRRPSTWRGTVRHEFLHAVGFHHAHQNMRGPCQASFRWEDDEGYHPTRDQRGTYIGDAAGKRPGIYTYLAGFPNFWDCQKVDRNLLTEEDPNLVAGPFDPQSVMLYRFPPLFYKTTPSRCEPVGDGQNLSEGDRRGLALLYPGSSEEIDRIVETQHSVLSSLESASPRHGGLERLAGTETGEFELFQSTVAAQKSKLAR